MSRYAFAAFAALSASLAPAAATAATATASTPFSVQVLVLTACTVNTSGTVQIGAPTGIYASALSTSIGSGTVSATCPVGQTYSLTLASTGSAFLMKGTTPNGVTIPYTVKYSGLTGGGSTALVLNAPVVHNTNTGNGSFTGAGTAQTITVTFTPGTPSGTLVPDTYTDTVQVTLTY